MATKKATQKILKDNEEYYKKSYQVIITFGSNEQRIKIQMLVDRIAQFFKRILPKGFGGIKVELRTYPGVIASSYLPHNMVEK